MQLFHEYIDVLLRLCVVYLSLFLFFLLDIISVSMPLSINIDVPIILMMVYYWSIYRPTLIPPLLVFGIGICLDLLSGWPLGINAFIFLVLQRSVISQRVFLMGQPFVVVWLGFMLAAPLSLFLQWALFGLIRLQWVSFDPVIISIFIGIVLFPAMALLLHVLHKILPEIQGQYSAVT